MKDRTGAQPLAVNGASDILPAALRTLEDLIADWESINRRFPPDINGHSMFIGASQITAFKVCAARLAANADASSSALCEEGSESDER